MKLYVLEAHSAEAANLFQSTAAQRIVSWLSDVEVITTLSRKVVDARLTGVEAAQAIADHRDDGMHGVYERKPVSEDIYLLAQRLVEQHGYSLTDFGPAARGDGSAPRRRWICEL